jgi:hypothetical protein
MEWSENETFPVNVNAVGEEEVNGSELVCILHMLYISCTRLDRHNFIDAKVAARVETCDSKINFD